MLPKRLRLTKLFLLVWLGLGGAFALGSEPLADGAVIPAAKLITGAGKSYDLQKFATQSGKRNLLIVFFRTGTCNVCVTQLRDVAAHYEEILGMNTAVLSLSLDDAIIQKRTSEMIESKFPILLDPDGKTVKAFGVFNPEEKLSRPSIYLVGHDQKVLYHYVGKSLADRPPLAEVLEVVRHYSGGLPAKSAVTAKAHP